MNTPYIGFEGNTLKKRPSLKSGEFIICPICQNAHKVEDSRPPLLLFYHCPQSGKDYLAGIDGKNIMAVKPDVSGNIDFSNEVKD